MLLNDLGKITQQYWLEIPQHFPHAILHEYIIMPNHIHGIIELTGVGAKNVSPNPNSPKSCNINNDSEAKNVSPLPRGTSQTIGSIIRGFKIGVTKQLGFSIWQRNYYEHIIRNETAYQNISNYIIHNPEKWHGDKFYIE